MRGDALKEQLKKEIQKYFSREWNRHKHKDVEGLRKYDMCMFKDIINHQSLPPSQRKAIEDILNI